MKKNIIFITIIVLIAVLLYLLSTKEVVKIPADENHVNIIEEKMCLNCHTEDKGNPLKKNHPPKYQCFKCHKRQKG